jgi:hypothetical protein
MFKNKKNVPDHRKLKIKMIRLCRVGARGYIVWGLGVIFLGVYFKI